MKAIYSVLPGLCTTTGKGSPASSAFALGLRGQVQECFYHCGAKGKRSLWELQQHPKSDGGVRNCASISCFANWSKDKSFLSAVSPQQLFLGGKSIELQLCLKRFHHQHNTLFLSWMCKLGYHLKKMTRFKSEPDFWQDWVISALQKRWSEWQHCPGLWEALFTLTWALYKMTKYLFIF